MDSERWDHLRRLLRRLFVRLSQGSSLLPKAMFLRDVILDFDNCGMPNLLGSGSYADVYAAQWVVDQPRSVVVKVFRPVYSSDNTWGSKDDRVRVRFLQYRLRHVVNLHPKLQLFQREVALQRYLDHPNICRPLGVLVDSSGNLSLRVVLPRMVDGNIMQFPRGNPQLEQADKYPMVCVLFWRGFKY